MTEELTQRLAYRTYLYELLHVIFGSMPTVEVMETLTGSTTLEVLSYYAEAQQYEQNDEFEHNPFLLCKRTLEEFLKQPDEDEVARELASSFTQLFMVPGDGYVHPWESPYRGKEAMLFQESTLDVRYRYKEFGFEADHHKRFPEDHIAMMLHFLGALSAEAYDAHVQRDDERLHTVLDAQGSFIEEHLTRWRSRFVEEIALKDSLGFYLAFARSLDVFVVEDMDFIHDEIAQLREGGCLV